MPKFTVFATISQRRAYVIEAEDSLEAQALVNEDWSIISSYDVIDEDLDDVEVEE